MGGGVLSRGLLGNDDLHGHSELTSRPAESSITALFSASSLLANKREPECLLARRLSTC